MPSAKPSKRQPISFKVNKAIPFSAAFVTSAAIAWMAAAPPAQRPATSSSTPPPRPARKPLTKAQIAADPEFAVAIERIRSAGTPKDQFQFTYDLALNIPDEDVEKWITHKLFKNENPTLETLFYRTIFARYSELDPVKCAIALSKPPDYGLKAHLKRWAAVDPQAVIKLAASATEERYRNSLLIEGISGLAKTDLQAAFEAVEKHRDNLHLPSGVMPVFASLDRKRLLEWADDPRHDRLRDQARNTVAETWLAENFNEAVTWMKSQEDAATLISRSVVSLKLDPSTAVERFQQLPPDLLASALGGITKSSEHFEQWLSFDYTNKAKISEEQAANIRQGVIVRLTYTDAAKGLEALRTYGLPGSSENSAESSNVYFNLNRAFEAVGGPVLEEWKTLIGEEKYADLRQSNMTPTPKLNIPIPAAEAMKQLGGTGKVEDKGFITHWSEEEMRQAIDTLPSIPAEQFVHFDRFLSLSLSEAENMNIPVSSVGTFSLRSAILTEGAKKNVDFRRHAYTEFTFDYAGKDPAAASGWAMSLPEGTDYRDRAIRGVAARYYASDPEAAEKWASQLPATERSAAQQVISHSQTNHPRGSHPQ